jgi:hypothetical protein
MKYFKNKQNELFVDPIVENHIGLEELTKEEFDTQLAENNIPTAEQIQANLKVAILKAIATMRVEVDGLVFDGNEPSQTRMARAIQTLVGDETIPWKMFDNSIETITQTELGKALRASGIKMSELWFCSTVEEVEAIVSKDSAWLDKYNG